MNSEMLLEIRYPQDQFRNIRRSLDNFYPSELFQENGITFLLYFPVNKARRPQSLNNFILKLFQEYERTPNKVQRSVITGCEEP